MKNDKLDYTAIPTKSIQDLKSLNAIGLLSYLLSHNATEEMTKSDIFRVSGLIKPEFNKAWALLIHKGFIEFERVENSMRCNYTIHNRPSEFEPFKGN